jgi:glycosyltransferase involved in cell wall biosynthesis
MKIAIEAQRIFRKKKHGMDIVALELIRKLQKIDHKNEYYILVKKDEDHKALKETGNFHIVELPGAPYPLWEQYYLPKAVKKIAPDLLHCTSNTAPLKVNAPLVLTLHDILYMQKIDLTRGSWYQRIGNLYRKWLVPKIVHSCKTIITVSDFEKKEIDRQFHFEEDKVKTVYNAFNPGFKPITDLKALTVYKKKYHLPERYLLFLGNTHPNKNMRTVLMALSKLHREHAIPIPLVMPDVDEGFLDKTLHEINDPGLKDKILLTGYVPNHELVYIYNLATVFLYPSFYESFGIPMLEAMSCGVPVIASNRAAMPEVSGGAALPVNPESAEEMAIAIRRLLTEETLYESCKNAGLRRASSFSWTLTAFEVLDIYYKIAQPRKTFRPQNATI